MTDNLMNLLRSSEIGAICASKKVGTHDKEGIDKNAVDAIQLILTSCKYPGEVVMGEGELDNAPMLYVGQKFNDKVIYDIAVDPVEGTNPAANNKPGAISTLASSKKGTMIKVPEMYMEKLFVSSKLKNVIDINKNLKQHVEEFKKINNNLKAIVLNKPRHKETIEWLIKNGVQVKLINDGDVMGAIEVVDGDADFLWGIGGSPEGSLMASLAIASNSEMIWQLVKFDDVKGGKLQSETRGQEEIKILKESGLEYNKPELSLGLVKDKEVAFVATAITHSKTLNEVKENEFEFKVSSLYAHKGSVRFIKSRHNKNSLFEKYPKLKDII
ncbi:MAG: fructose-bisphosphatase class II family protein [Mycoplasma sp.]|nr:fructose-bisphosphatase class II family protein [Mycoplasma sp.]